MWCYGLDGFQAPDVEQCFSSWLVPYYEQRAHWAASNGAHVGPSCYAIIAERLFESTCETAPPASSFGTWEAQTCKLFVGDGVVGSACQTNPEPVLPLDDTCGEGLYCREGQCAAIPGEGEPCEPVLFEWSWCGGNTQCQEGVCRPYPGVGEACGPQGCGDGAYCDGGACVAAPTAGEACGTGGACAGSACINDVCAPPGPGVCRATLF